MPGKHTKEMMAMLHSQGRREWLKYVFFFGGVTLLGAIPGFYAMFAYTEFMIQSNARDSDTVGAFIVLGAFVLAFFLMTFLYQLLGWEPPVRVFRQWKTEEYEHDDFSIPKFPYSLQELREDPSLLEITGQQYKEVLLVKALASTNESTEHYQIADVVIRDVEGGLYDVKRFRDEYKAEMYGRELAQVMGIHFQL